MDTVQISDEARERAEQECSRRATVRKFQTVRLPGMGFIGWTVACLRDLIERGEEATYCDQCDIEIAPEENRHVDGIGPLCETCEAQLEERAWREAREQRESDHQDWLAYQRR